ncbi:MAG: DUF350 domain-containing protein [Pseudobdellovibrionaceae bacterium]|jgi:putative membrane protein
MAEYINLKFVVGAILFSIIGLILQWIAFWLFDRMTPGRLWHEIVEKQNIALAITAGAMIIAISQIISSAING